MIDINGVRNKLSGSSAPYPNHNNRFNYVLSGGTDGFLIQKNANEYRIENLTLSFLDEKELYNSSGEVWEPQTHTSDAGRGQVFSGRITMKKNGCFRRVIHIERAMRFKLTDEQSAHLKS